MKLRSLAILVLLTWIFQVGFPYLSYELRRKNCWDEFLKEKSGFVPQETQKFFFTHASEVSWERDRQEFSFEGTFYDVLRVEEKDGGQLIWCVADEDEITLLNAYEDYLRHHEQHKARRLKKWNYFFQHRNEFVFPVENEENTQVSYRSELRSTFSEVKSPPPKMMT